MQYLLIAKGQANFELLRKSGMFARNFGVPRMTGMIVNDKEL